MHTLKKLDNGLVELSFELSAEDVDKDVRNAAVRLSEEKPLDGFRPGKAPYDVIKSRFGEMALYEAALPAIVRKSFVKAVEEEKLRTYGEPSINVTALAPGNPVKYVATVAVVPEVTKLADRKKVKVERKKVSVGDDKVEGAIKELARMQTREVKVEREARDKDKVVIDMDMSQAGVPLDGGQAKGHGVYLDEEYYVPGFKEQVLGLKEGDKKTFSLKFPEGHYQKNLAGQDVDFAVTVKEVNELVHPEIDDTFAQKLGQKDIATLRGLLKTNMQKEEEDREDQRIEIELLEKLVDASTFGDIPEKILNDEVARMIDELKHSVAQRGVQFDDYLQNIKKTLPELKLEFAPQAAKRIKTALLIRAIGEQENIEIADEEVLAEIQRHMNESAGDAEAQKFIRSDEYEGYVRSNLRNRRVLKMLREEVTK